MDEHRLRITWIVPHFPPHIGGGERLYMDVCRFLVSQGVRVRVVTSCSGGIKGHRSVNGVSVYYCDWPMLFGHPVVRMRDIVSHVRWCDIVHTSIYSTAPYANLAAFIEKKKCVTTIHEVMGKKWFWFEKNPLKATAFFILERLIIKTSPIVHVVSKATASDYRTYGGKSRRLFVIYNFIDLPSREEIDAESISFKEYFSLEDGERGILYFGRPAKNKGIFVILDAISQLPQEKVEKNRIRFCFILAKAPENDYKKAIKVIKESSLSRYIIVKESLPRKELLKVVSEADLCVIPSVTEGFGYAAAEACVLNGRVLSSDAGSLKEVVGGTCQFFKNRNHKDLAEKLLSYMVDGTDGFLNLKEKRFDKELITKKYLDMYRTVLHDTF